MRDFALYIADSRYSIPTLLMASLPDEAAARALASRTLAQNEHYLSIEVAEDGLPLAVVMPGEGGEAGPAPQTR